MSLTDQTIVLLVANMSGTAEMVADEMAQEIKKHGLASKGSADDLTKTRFENGDAIARDVRPRAA